MFKIVVTLFFLVLLQTAFAQIPRGFGGGGGGMGGANNSFNRSGGNPNSSKGGASDTSSKSSTLGFEHRDDAKDSITIGFKYLDSIRNNKFDTSINDFYNYFILEICIASFYEYLLVGYFCIRFFVFNLFMCLPFFAFFLRDDIHPCPGNKFGNISFAFIKSSPFKLFITNLRNGRNLLLSRICFRCLILLK